MPKRSNQPEIRRNEDRHSPWSSPLIVPGLLLLALGVRWLAWGYQKTVSVDGTTYIRLARSLFGGPPFDTVMPPGYPALIGLVHRLGVGDEVRAAQWVSLVCGTLLILPFHALARRLLDSRRGALLLTLLLALSPLAIRYSVTTLSESAYLLFVVTAAALAVTRRPLTAGLLGGAAVWIRPEAFVFTGALAVEEFLRARRTRGDDPPAGAGAAPAGARPGRAQPGARAALAILAGLVLTGVVPSLLYNHATSGRWTLSRKTINLAPANPLAREVTVAQTLAGPAATGALDRLTHNAGEIARNYPRAFLQQVRQLGAAAGVPALPLLVVGAFVAPAGVLPGLAQAFVAPAFPAVAMSPRLAAPLLPFALLLAALGVRALARRWPRFGVTGLGGLLGAGWLAATLVAVPGLRINEDGNYPELRDAGLALKTVAPAGALVFDRKPYTAFYAGGRLKTIPTGDYSEVVDAMNQVGGEYLVVAEAVARVFRPELLPLVEDRFTMLNDPRLQLIYLDERYARRRVAIYRFVREGMPPPGADERDLAARLARGIPEDTAQAGLHADLLRRRGDYEGMCRACESLLVQEPDNWRAMLNLSLGLITLDKDLGRALRLAHQAARVAPGEPAARTMAAWADSLCHARGVSLGDGQS